MKNFSVCLALVLCFSVGVVLVESCIYGNQQIMTCLSYNSDYYYPQESCEGGRAATTDDANAIGLVNGYNSWISSNLGTECPSGFPAVTYDYPTLDDLACVTQGSTYITNVQTNIAQEVLVNQKFTNNDNSNVSYTFELQTTFTNQQTYEVSSSSSFSISDKLSFSVSEAGFDFGNSLTITSGIQNSQTYGTSYTTTEQISETPTVNVPPGTCVSASINGNITQLAGTIVVPSFLNGPLRCDFGSPVCGHYYWIANMQQCESDALVDTTVGVLVSYNIILSDCESGETLYESETHLV